MRPTWPGLKLRVSPDLIRAFSTVLPSGAAMSTQLSPLNCRLSAPVGAVAAAAGRGTGVSEAR